MNTIHTFSPAVLALLASVLPALPQERDGGERAAPRSATAILRDMDRVFMPSFSDGNSPEALARFREQIEEASRRKADLARELYTGHPDHERLAEVLAMRWALMTNALHRTAEVIQEAGIVVEDNEREDLRRAAHFAAGWAALQNDELPAARRIALVEKALETNRDHDYIGGYLVALARRHTADPAAIRKLIDRGRALPSLDARSRFALADLERGLGRIGAKLQCGFVDMGTGGSIDLTAPVDGVGHTIVQIRRTDYGSAADAVAELKALQRNHPGLRLLTVFADCGQIPTERIEARVREDGISWPVHRDPRFGLPWTRKDAKQPRDPWSEYASLGFLLLDGSGRLVAFSQRPAVLAERLVARRTRTP